MGKYVSIKNLVYNVSQRTSFYCMRTKYDIKFLNNLLKNPTHIATYIFKRKNSKELISHTHTHKNSISFFLVIDGTRRYIVMI